MSIRIACPTCLTALTLPDTSAGKSRICPKCNLMFRVPVPETVANRPVPEATLLSGEGSASAPPDQRPPARPIYKQSKNSSASGDLSADSSERKSGDRVRRKRRIRAKETNVSPALLIGGGVAALAILVGIGYAAVQFSGETPSGPKPMIPNDGGKGVANEGPAIPDGPTVEDLPKTWSLNAPALGFRAAWPVPAGALGYCPVEALNVNYNNQTPVSWSYTESVSRIVRKVSVTDLPDGGTPDEETVLDRHVDKLKRDAPAGVAVGVVPLSIGGHPARQVAFVTDMERSIQRVTLKGNQLWTVIVVCPQHIAADDPRLVLFLNSFQPL